MRVLILAGGLGTRLRPAIGSTPKSMVPVAGRPFLEYLLAQVTWAGLHDVAIFTGHGAEAVEGYFGTGHERVLQIAFSLAVSRVPDERFLVMNGDSFFDIPLRSLVDAHRDSGALATLALARSSERARFGGVAMDADGRVSRFEEKGEPMPADLVNAGIYVIERSLLGGMTPGRALSLWPVGHLAPRPSTGMLCSPGRPSRPEYRRVEAHPVMSRTLR